MDWDVVTPNGTITIRAIHAIVDHGCLLLRNPGNSTIAAFSPNGWLSIAHTKDSR